MNYALAEKKVAQLAEADATARRAKARAEKLRRELAHFFGSDTLEGRTKTKVQNLSRHAAGKKLRAPAVARVAQRPPIRKSPTPAPANETPKVSGAAPGTKGHDVLTVLHGLGGKGSAKTIATRMANEGSRTEVEHRKLVRSYLSYLRTKGLVLSVRRGVWKITEQGHAAIGVHSQSEIGQPAMFKEQEGRA